MLKNPVQILREAGFRCLYTGASALDAYLRIPERFEFHLLTDAGLVDLGRLFDGLGFGTSPADDARLLCGEQRWIFYCRSVSPPENGAVLPVLRFHYDDEKKEFLDPDGVLPLIQQRRTGTAVPGMQSGGRILVETARLIARYRFEPDAGTVEAACAEGPLGTVWLRTVLETVLSGQYAADGLALLDAAGVVAAHWPELERLKGVRQDKEFHPEGNAWQHTLETLRQRRHPGLRLGLGLLLHDTGKAVAPETRDRPFADHSRHGVPEAARFLRRLGYPDELVSDVLFLVRNHMLPAALDRLPVHRTRSLMESPLFPVLLELSRADLASTWSDMEEYHRARRAFGKFCRNRRNPFRDDAGNLQRLR